MDEYTRRQIIKYYELYSGSKEHFLKEEDYRDVNKSHEFALKVMEMEFNKLNETNK